MVCCTTEAGSEQGRFTGRAVLSHRRKVPLGWVGPREHLLIGNDAKAVTWKVLLLCGVIATVFRRVSRSCRTTRNQGFAEESKCERV